MAYKYNFSNYHTALELFLHAEKLAPGFYSKNQVMIGKCYLQLGDKLTAKQYFNNVKWWKDVIMDQGAYQEACHLLNHC